LRFTLPLEALELEIDGADQDGRFEVTADGFVDKLALPPGQSVRQVLYRYALPYSEDSWIFLPLAALSGNQRQCAHNGPGAAGDDRRLINQGMRETPTATSITWWARTCPPISRSPSTSPGCPAEPKKLRPAGATNQPAFSFGPLIGLAAAGAALLVALPLLRRGRPATASLQTREDLVAALARLDLAYEAVT